MANSQWIEAIKKAMAESTTYTVNPWLVNGDQVTWRSAGDGILPGQVHYVGGEKLIGSTGKVPKPDESSDWRQYL